jgi:hypothetical protein
VAPSGPELALEVGPGHYVIGRSIVVRQTPAELVKMALRYRDGAGVVRQAIPDLLDQAELLVCRDCRFG